MWCTFLVHSHDRYYIIQNRRSGIFVITFDRNNTERCSFHRSKEAMFLDSCISYVFCILKIVSFVLLSCSIYIITRNERLTLITPLITRRFFRSVVSYYDYIRLYITTFSFLFCHDLRRYEDEGITLLTSYRPSLLWTKSPVYSESICLSRHISYSHCRLTVC